MEITLYDDSGKPVAYLDIDDENTIWMWEGHAVAYIEDNVIFGWNGEHLGWFIDQIIYDLNGYRVGYTGETCPRNLKLEPFKKFKRFKRFKRFQRHVKSMRTLKVSTSERNLKEFLESGSVD